jgi:hypothetical protein
MDIPHLLFTHSLSSPLLSLSLSVSLSLPVSLPYLLFAVGFNTRLLLGRPHHKFKTFSCYKARICTFMKVH